MAFRSPRSLIRIALATLLATAAQFSSAAVTDIAQSPLIVASQDSVRANLLFILDDSGSMNFDFMPDHINGDGSPDPRLCRSSGATPVDSGAFNNTCCIGGNNSAACWTGAAPFGTLRGQPPFLAASFNGLAYDPSTQYKPPVKADGSSWPSQTRTNTSVWTSVKNDAYNIQNTGSIDLITQFPDTEWCTDGTYTDCLRNDNYVLPGTVNGKAYTTYHATVATGTGLVATGAPDAATTASRAFAPHYYRIIPAEYCTGVDLRSCSATAGSGYVYPAPLRWCKTDADTRATTPAANACQATRNSNFTFARYPTKFFTAGSAGSPEVPAKVTFTITSSPSCNIQVTAVTVGGLNLMGTATSASTNRGTIGNAIRDSINNKSPASGYTATTSNSGRTVTITAPAGLNTTATLSFTKTPGGCTFPLDNNNPAFSGYAAAVPVDPGTYGGSFQRIDIVATAAPFARPATRLDCADVFSRKAAGVCTYDEEMTNFANWWTYYHSRMQAMKSSAALAFGAVGNNRRVGYMSINNNTGTDFLNLDTFENRTSPAYNQKTNWFSKLTAAIPNNSTPLRAALSKAGKLYAGRYNPINSQTTSLNGVTTVDPVQYSCQRNFTILSTDGFWNEASNPTKLDNTEMGDQDGALARPMLDGSATGNTLADVSAYYLNTDLRTGTTGANECKSYSGTNADVCGNGNSSPRISFQQMKTFTLGLGASGFMQFSPSYVTDTSGDFYAVREGLSPSATICSWQASGTCTWPTPVSNTLTTIDDLWHAAVNGGGTYFSASNPTSLLTGLATAIGSMDAEIGASAAATASNPNISAGDDKVFLSNFTSAEWWGELRAQHLDLTTGAVGTGAPDWTASTQVDAMASRNIYMFSAGSPGKLKAFSWGAMTPAEQAYFSLANVTASGRALTQFCAFGPNCLSAADQAIAAGDPLVEFLRGDRSNEGELTAQTKYFRKRVHRLGDIVNSKSAYVSKSMVNYIDADYDAFKATVANRQGVVYVGANDGMLHAFSADTGNELWAYVPTAVLPNLYKLADKQYATQHQYSVDGNPFVQDVYINGAWRTILVSGLRAGGRSYFALDVTDPADPKALWEFTDTNLGYTFGTPEVGKLEDGTWVVVFASGYNNVSPGDGVGRLYVVNAATGALIRSISTGVGSTTTPSGLAHVRGWLDNSDLDNTIKRVYGGDNLGNLYRFDINNNVGAAGYDAQRIATLKDNLGNSQPITSRPELGHVGTIAMVFVGTGRYLGQTDLSDASKQTIYGIKDNLNAVDIGDPRLTANRFVQQTLTAGTCPAGSSACEPGATVRTNGTPNPVNLATNGGWYVDLPQSRERVNTDPQLALGTLVVASNVIDSGNVCTVGGSSWLNFLDYRTGAAVDSAKTVTSVFLGDFTSTEPTLNMTPDGQLHATIVCSSGCTKTNDVPTPSVTAGTRRLTWRDLLQQ